MRLTIKSFAMIREAVGSKEIEMEVEATSSLFEIVQLFCQKYPSSSQYILENNEVKNSLTIALNGEAVDPNSYSHTMINSNDIIIFIPPAGGG